MLGFSHCLLSPKTNFSDYVDRNVPFCDKHNLDDGDFFIERLCVKNHTRYALLSPTLRPGPMLCDQYILC